MRHRGWAEGKSVPQGNKINMCKGSETRQNTAGLKNRGEESLCLEHRMQEGGWQGVRVDI